MAPYAFIDRDGTLIWEPDRPEGADPQSTYPLKSADDLRFLPGVLSSLKVLVARGYKLVMATNQTGLGTSRNPRNVFDETMARIDEALALHNIFFEFVMVCPHEPKDNCACRKPKIGGLQSFFAEREGEIDFSRSLMFGDRDTDEQFAENLGVRFVRVPTNGNFALPDNLSASSAT